MENREITCIECPRGCLVRVSIDNGNIVEVVGNSCPRGDTYARNEVTCPRRVLTTTVKTSDGGVVAVKTDKPIKKADIFAVMDAVNKIVADTPIEIGDILKANIVEDINLIATDNKR